MTLTCRLGLEIQECFLCLIISITEHLTIRIFKLNADQRNFCLTDIIRGDLKPRDIIREILSERYYLTDMFREDLKPRDIIRLIFYQRRFTESSFGLPRPVLSLPLRRLGQPQQQEISSSTRLSSVNNVQTIKVHWWWLRLISNLHTHHSICCSNCNWKWSDLP